MKKVITKNEYLALAGLFYLANEARKKVEECEKTFIKIVDYPKKYGLDSGHFGDQLWQGNGSIDEVLKLEEIKVK